MTGCIVNIHTLSEVQISENDCFADRKTMVTLTNQEGRILEQGSLFLIELKVGSDRLAPCNLPEELKSNGLILILDAKVKEIFPEERWAGQPCVLTKIIVKK
jgi:hypothetical protein